jgi:hypothetical protein
MRVKRKWGESLSARREVLQKAQLLPRGVTYNPHRLVLLGLLRVQARLRGTCYLRRRRCLIKVFDRARGA